MNNNRLAARMARGDVVVGFSIHYPASGIVETMGSGWDFIWIDAQHGQFSCDTSLPALQAAKAMDLDSVLRVPSHESGTLGIFADLAPSAIMVPMVNTVEQAQAVVEALRFPPRGKRSFGGRRVIDLYGRDYCYQNNLMVIVQIETLEAVRNAAGIASVDGIDMLFFGPDDVKVQMGLPMNITCLDNEDLKSAMQSTARAAREAGRFCGSVGVRTEVAVAMVEAGYQMIVGGGDVLFLRSESAERLGRMRAALQGVSCEAFPVPSK